ncbi:MAG: PepSY domain-containing protein [Euryarchaeota archaeon]
MDKKIIILVVIAVLIIIGAGYTLFLAPAPVNNTTNMTNITTNNTTVTNETETPAISAQEAMEIVNTQVIAEPGFVAANPRLYRWDDGRLVWNVQIVDAQGQAVDGVDIDATTGQVLGRG